MIELGNVNLFLSHDREIETLYYINNGVID